MYTWSGVLLNLQMLQLVLILHSLQIHPNLLYQLQMLLLLPLLVFDRFSQLIVHALLLVIIEHHSRLLI